MSCDAYAYLVIGVKFSDIGRVFDERRQLTLYTATGKPYQQPITQTVVEVMGQPIPDDPDPDRPVWKDYDDPISGTCPYHNFAEWLTSKDRRWSDEEEDGSLIAAFNFQVLGVRVVDEVSDDYPALGLGEVPDDLEPARALARELLATIGYTGPLKTYLTVETD